jgi:hypothetical protein
LSNSRAWAITLLAAASLSRYCSGPLYIGGSVQIILVSRHLKAARTITIMPRHVLTVVSFSCCPGFQPRHYSPGCRSLRLPVVEKLLVSTAAGVEKGRSYVTNNLQLMATRLGELQAQVCNSIPWVSGYGLGRSKAEPEAAGKAGPGRPFFAGSDGRRRIAA